MLKAISFKEDDVVPVRFLLGGGNQTAIGSMDMGVCESKGSLAIKSKLRHNVVHIHEVDKNKGERRIECEREM